MLNFFKKNNEGFKTLSLEECKNLMDIRKDLVYLDVRTEKEHESEGNIENSLVIDFFKLSNFKKEIEKLDKNLPYLVYCAVGGRSKAAAALMVKMGFVEVYDMAGGLKAWQKTYSNTQPLITKLSQEEAREKREDIMKRLSKIEGQVRGVKKMVDNEDYCANILNQTLAINSAMKSVNKEIMELFLNVCLNEERNMEDFFTYVKKMMK